ncbi:MAG: nicotinate phosphoribosyltransferase [Ectothiorhodospiraceae bacterium]|nr:nicotinate phosphoribosyltransferase [Ectothiorhodospiraceae bacterium]
MRWLSAEGDELGLFTDLYELTMAQAYWYEGMHADATFSLFFRKPPENRNLILACGQEHAAELVTQLHFPRRQLDRLAGLGMFRDDFLRFLEAFRFTGEIRAMADGTPVFPQEPLLEITAPVIEAQVLETVLMNYVHLETLLASKALRVVGAARGRPVLDFGMRRMHGQDAALRGARAYAIGGIHGTSNVLGGLRYGVTPQGTMAHSFIQAHADELQAFRTYAELYPGTTLLVDTYDTLAGVEKVIRLARDEGLDIGAIRLDSGDMAELARQARQRLDAAGLPEIRIVASGGLDEWKIDELLRDGAPIDGFGVGTDMGTSSDAPSLDLVYKLTEYGGEPRLKNSPGKQITPGRKQVWRFSDRDGCYSGDEITQVDESRQEGEALLRPLVRRGELLRPPGHTHQARQRARAALDRMPPSLRRLEPATRPYPVMFSETLISLREQALAALPDTQG